VFGTKKDSTGSNGESQMFSRETSGETRAKVLGSRFTRCVVAIVKARSECDHGCGKAEVDRELCSQRPDVVDAVTGEKGAYKGLPARSSSSVHGGCNWKAKVGAENKSETSTTSDQSSRPGRTMVRCWGQLISSCVKNIGYGGRVAGESRRENRNSRRIVSGFRRKLSAAVVLFLNTPEHRL
jgi:hypothetical protein